MQGEQTAQDGLFVYGSLDSLVPADDRYRRLDALLDLAWVRRETRHLYSRTGRPSVDPVVIAKLLLIAYFQGITSERELLRQVQPFLAHCGLLRLFASWLCPNAPVVPYTQDFVAACRQRNVTPHVASNDTRRGGSAIDARTTRHTGYRLSQTIRKRIEEHFGWGKTVGRIRQTVFRGLQRVDRQFKLTMTASNLKRMARILFAVPQGATP